MMPMTTKARPALKLKKWVIDLYDGSSVKRYIRVMEAIESHRELSPREIAALPGLDEDAVFVDRIVNAAKRAVQPREVALLANPDDGTLQDIPAFDRELNCADIRAEYEATRELFAVALETAADAADQRRSPTRHPPRRWRMGQMLRFRAEQVRHPEKETGADAAAANPPPGKRGHYNVAPDYLRMKRWLRAQKEQYPDSWYTSKDATLHKARSMAEAEIVAKSHLYALHVEHAEAEAAYKNCLTGGRDE